MEGRYQCADLAPYKSGHLDCRMVCFLRHRGLSPVGDVDEWKPLVASMVSPTRHTALSSQHG